MAVAELPQMEPAQAYDPSLRRDEILAMNQRREFVDESQRPKPPVSAVELAAFVNNGEPISQQTADFVWNLHERPRLLDGFVEFAVINLVHERTTGVELRLGWLQKLSTPQGSSFLRRMTAPLQQAQTSRGRHSSPNRGRHHYSG